MNKKIFKSMILISTLAVMVCIASVSSVLYGYFGQIIEDELKEEAHMVTHGIEQDENYFDSLGYTENRITLIDKEGRVLFDSQADAADMENHRDRKEISEAMEKGEAFSTRYSDTLAVKTIYYAKKLDDGNVLRIAHEQSVVMLLLKGVAGPLVLIMAAIIVISAILSKFIAIKIVTPINNIDINDPEIEEPYAELSPLIMRIRQQNKHIAAQMAELVKKQKEFTDITENMSEGFLLIDKNMEILSYNTSALRLLGDMKTTEPHTAYELNRTAAFREVVEQALSGIHSQNVLEKGDRYYNLMASPVIEKEQVAGAVVIVMDATEKEQRDRLRREFTSNVSHELKTPLTTIYGVSDMMAEGIVKNSDIKDFSRTIKEESGRMISLINDIIKLSRLDENSFYEESGRVDILDISKEVIQRLSMKAEEKKVSIFLEGEHMIVDGIPSLCSEIVYNLCDNGIKYNKENGSVTVTVGRGENGDTVLSVEDTGIGIPQGAEERIFERFFRADKSHCRQVEGTGLGLSIVKHAAAHMGGRVLVESTEGKGTKMTVIWPASDK